MKTIVFDNERLSDSPFVERIWTSHSDHGGGFTSAAECRWEIVTSRLRGNTTLCVRGPESRATRNICPPEGEWMGIRFRPDTYLAGLTPKSVTNTARQMPAAGKARCWMFGQALEIPSYDNVESFIAELVRLGSLTRDTVLSQSLTEGAGHISARTAQRRFARILGLSANQVFQMDRARYAAGLLRDGKTILDTVQEAGYFDQAHLTKWVKALIGVTPGKIAEAASRGQLSFLYNTKLPTSF